MTRCGKRSAARRSRNQTRLVGAPLVGAHHKGTHEGCPYESRQMVCKKTGIHDLALQISGVESAVLHRSKGSADLFWRSALPLPAGEFKAQCLKVMDRNGVA